MRHIFGPSMVTIVRRDSVFAESFANLLSGSYGLAEGKSGLTNGDTPVIGIPVDGILTGYYSSNGGSLIGRGRSSSQVVARGRWWSNQLNSNRASYLNFGTEILRFSDSDPVNNGSSVDAVILFQSIFSGSYGLAVGNNVANADTSILTLSSIRSRLYRFDGQGSSGRQCNDYDWSMQKNSDITIRSSCHSESRVAVDQLVYAGEGYSVLLRPSLIISPEAMGWPWELLQKRIRQSWRLGFSEQLTLLIILAIQRELKLGTFILQGNTITLVNMYLPLK